MYEYLGKAVRFWGKCPSCQAINSMLDYNRYLYCQVCEKWTPKKDVVRSKNNILEGKAENEQSGEHYCSPAEKAGSLFE